MNHDNGNVKCKGEIKVENIMEKVNLKRNDMKYFIWLIGTWYHYIG